MYLVLLIVNIYICEIFVYCVKFFDRNYGLFIEVKVYVFGLIF